MRCPENRAILDCRAIRGAVLLAWHDLEIEDCDDTDERVELVNFVSVLDCRDCILLHAAEAGELGPGRLERMSRPQPLVDLAAKEMASRSQRPRSQPYLRFESGQGRRGAREDEWYCTIFQPDSSCESTEVATPSRSITRPSSSSIR